jgi:hypothetical protein
MALNLIVHFVNVGLKQFLIIAFAILTILKKKQGFYISLFREKKSEEKFIPKPSVDTVVFSSFMKLLRRMHVIF